MRLPLLALALIALALVPGSAEAASKKKTTYLSLGDSLAASYQKQADGTAFLASTGYSEVLPTLAKQRFPGLKLDKSLACPGEDTTTFQQGGRANCAAYASKATSQLKAAVKYLKRNRSKVAFVTVSIGANNFTSCAKAGQAGVDIACIAAGQAKLEKDLPKIFKALRKAAGKKMPIAVLAPYDPFLAFWLSGGDTGYGLAELSIGLAKQIRDTIAGAAKKERFALADAFKSFETERFAERTTLPNGLSVPVAVARICQYTFMCAPAPQGPDIHANDAGYRKLAETFKKALKLK